MSAARLTNLQQLQVNAIESLQHLLARGGALRVGRRGSVVAV
ncbi:MAG: hypothetical protein ACYC0T_17955 [Ramlibacter sp.]